MPVTTLVEGFSISHAAILTAAGAEETFGDIYAVNSGSLDLTLSSFSNVGDDAVLSIWDWVDFATISIQAGYISFNLIALLTGNTLSSSGSGASIQYNIELWEETSFNEVERPMRIRIPSRDSESNARLLDIILYKVKFKPLVFTGIAYKEGLKVNYDGVALLSDTDHEGNSLTHKAVGRMISLAAV